LAAAMLGQWQYYQEWNDALFFHWEVPFDLLRSLVSEALTPDHFEGKYYVSLVAFSMQKIRPRNLPSVKFLSDFHEINVRTYIDMDGKKGVYFLNIEAEKAFSAFVARKLSGLPYEKAVIDRTADSYQSVNHPKQFRLNAHFKISGKIHDKTALNLWITERYCLYLDQKNALFRFDIHHAAWELNHVEIKKAEVNYQLGQLKITSETPFFTHYSKGVKVLSWRKSKFNPLSGTF
jgi:uncharacterized protein YqjF (DUF2071 family)